MSDYGKSDLGFDHRTTSLEPVAADLGTATTPVDRFFVCSASDAVRLDRDSWQLSIDGDCAVDPVSIGYDALATLDQVEVDAWLECAGNGRTLFTLVDGQTIPPENAHTLWSIRAMGMASWRGPTLRSVLELAGIGDDAAFVSPLGLDIESTEGEPARMCMPLDKALDPATIVATHMNGTPLVPAHGAPVRLVVPGWIGAYSVKWLGGLTISSQWVPSWRADEYYVHRTPDGTITGPVTHHPVKSNLALPFPAALTAGRHELFGYARSGEGTISAVEWSLDDAPFQPARLDPPIGDHAWTVFRLDVELDAGEHVLRTRATDATGSTQPDQQPFHPYGVLWHSVIPHPVTVLG